MCQIRPAPIHCPPAVICCVSYEAMPKGANVEIPDNVISCYHCGFNYKLAEQAPKKRLNRLSSLLKKYKKRKRSRRLSIYWGS